MTAQDILPRLKRVRANGNRWTALCPAHDDRHPSLSICEKDGKTLLYCFKGCAYEAILEALGEALGVPNMKNSRQIAAVYAYTDEKGVVLYENVRFEPKDFAQRRYDAEGNPIWNLNGTRRVPYRLPELLRLSGNDAFVMTEGEKDADALTANGLIATSHKNWKREFNYLLKGLDVVICQDHDKAGVAQVKKVVEIIKRDARAIKIIDCFATELLPEKHGKDVSDLLSAASFDDFCQLIKRTPNYNLNTAKNDDNATGFSVISLADVEAKEVVWL
jgi:putative DNA primase/helicase